MSDHFTFFLHMTEADILEMIEKKVNIITRQFDDVFELAFSYYVQNGRGAMVMNFINVEQLFCKETKLPLMYMPLEIAANVDENETIKLILSYDPLHEFIMFISVEDTSNLLHLNICVYSKKDDTLTPLRLKRTRRPQLRHAIDVLHA